MTDSTVTRYSNYFERYNDEALDPFAGNYSNLMATFRASVGREPNARANQLYEEVFVTSEVQPHIYLMLTQDVQGAPTISVLHRPYRHVAPMGSPVPKIDVAFLGDMRGLLPPTVVYFPEDGFSHTGNILVPKLETVHLKLLDLTSKTSQTRITLQPGLLFTFRRSSRPLPWPILQ
jgi:hypothetical protein